MKERRPPAAKEPQREAIEPCRAADDVDVQRFKAELFHKLQRSGVLDSIKARTAATMTTKMTQTPPAQAHLRAQLLSKLCDPPTARQPSPPKSLAILTTDLLVADYLFHRRYHYSLSVFQPEAGVAGWLTTIPVM